MISYSFTLCDLDLLDLCTVMVYCPLHFFNFSVRCRCVHLGALRIPGSPRIDDLNVKLCDCRIRFTFYHLFAVLGMCHGRPAGQLRVLKFNSDVIQFFSEPFGCI